MPASASNTWPYPESPCTYFVATVAPGQKKQKADVLPRAVPDPPAGKQRPCLPPLVSLDRELPTQNRRSARGQRDPLAATSVLALGRARSSVQHRVRASRGGFVTKAIVGLGR
jgi:hypothetical protein